MIFSVWQTAGTAPDGPNSLHPSPPRFILTLSPRHDPNNTFTFVIISTGHHQVTSSILWPILNITKEHRFMISMLYLITVHFNFNA